MSTMYGYVHCTEMETLLIKPIYLLKKMLRGNPGGSAGAHAKILEQTAAFLGADKSYLEPLKCLPTTLEFSSIKPD